MSDQKVQRDEPASAQGNAAKVQRDLREAVVLLKATLEILNKADEGPYVQNVFELTAHYDNTECDGLCLKEDIENFLEEIGDAPTPQREEQR